MTLQIFLIKRDLLDSPLLIWKKLWLATLWIRILHSKWPPVETTTPWWTGLFWASHYKHTYQSINHNEHHIISWTRHTILVTSVYEESRKYKRPLLNDFFFRCRFTILSTLKFVPRVTGFNNTGTVSISK